MIAALVMAMAAIAGTIAPITKTTSGTYTLGQSRSDVEAIVAAEAKRERKRKKRLTGQNGSKSDV